MGRKVCLLIIAFFSTFFLAQIEIERISPPWVRGVSPFRRDAYPYPNIFSSDLVFMTNTNSTSDCLMDIKFRVILLDTTGNNKVDWTTLRVRVSGCFGRELSYPDPYDTTGVWHTTRCYLQAWVELYGFLEDTTAWHNLIYKARLPSQLFIDTLSVDTFIVTVKPLPDPLEDPYVYVPMCYLTNDAHFSVIHLPSFEYRGPCFYMVCTDRDVPGFTMNALSGWSSEIFVYVSDSRGHGGNLQWDYDVDYSGPVASNPLPQPSTIIGTINPHISLTILDTISYIPEFLPPDRENSCWCLASDCFDPTGNWIQPPWCDVLYGRGGFIDSTSIRLSVNGREFRWGDEGLYWHEDTVNFYRGINSRLTLNTAEAGISFSPGDTVEVCLLEATDVVTGGYGPNHLGRYRDWTHPDTPIPFCWEFYISPTAVSETQTKPEQLTLAVYPNPANQTVRVEYTVPNQNRVTVTVHDILGRKVETLVDTEKQPGRYSVQWSTEGVSSGVYLISLKSRSTSLTRKTVFLK